MPIITKTGVRNITILSGSTMTVLAGALLAPSLPDMALAFQDVPNAEFLVMLTLTMPALFIALGSPFAGILLDKLGRKPVLIVSLILYGISGTSGFFVDSLFGILVGRAFLGLEVAGIMSGFTTLIADYFTGPQLNKFMGYQGAAIGLGGMVSFILAGFLADIGWRLPFLIYLAAFIVLPGVLLSIDEPVRLKATEGKDQRASAPFPLKPFVMIYSITFASMAIFFLIPILLPFYLTMEGGVSNSQVGIALAAQTLTSIIMALLYYRLRARLSFLSLAAFVFLFLGINNVIISITPAYSVVVVALLIGGLGLGILPPNLGAWVASTAPPSMRGRAVGGFTMFLFLGQFASPLIIQPFVQQFGFAGAFLGAGAVSMILTIVIVGFVLYNRLQRKH